MPTYRMAKGWATFIYIGGTLLILVMGWLLLMPFMLEDTPVEMFYFMGPLSLGMIAFMVIGILDTYSSRLIIEHEKVTYNSTFVNRELHFTEIKGYQLNDYYLFIQPKDKHKKRIKVSTYFGQTGSLIYTLSQHFPDLDQLSREAERIAILDNAEFGGSRQERSERLDQIKKATKLVNGAGLAIALWCMFYPYPYEWCIWVAILTPLIALGVMAYYRRLISVDDNPGSAYPSMLSGIILAASALMVRTMFDFDLTGYSNVYLPVTVLALLLLALVLVTAKRFEYLTWRSMLSLTFLFVCFVGYSYGAIVALNCLYDTSDPQVYETEITDKRISSGNSTSYYFDLTPWGEQIENEEVSVSEELYESQIIGNTVYIYKRQGYFQIPWFAVVSK